METYSGPTGAFRLTLPAPGDYLAGAAHAGYFELHAQPVHVEASGTEVNLVLNPQREVFQSVQVGELPNAVDPAQTQSEQRLSGTEVNDVPYAASNSLRNAMQLIPGVVQDPTGSLHFHGGGEYQTQYTLDGFDITNPIDGRSHHTRLAVEGVRSLDLETARETASITGAARRGRWRSGPTPGPISFITPPPISFPAWKRAMASRLAIGRRAWAFPATYREGPRVVFRQPGRRVQQRIHLRPARGAEHQRLLGCRQSVDAQVNTTRANILYADFLSDFDSQAHLGLGPLDPTSTTSALKDRQWLAAVKDSQSWGQGNLVEVGAAWQTIYSSQVPLGDEPYVLAPTGRSGNYFLTSREDGRRDQLFVISSRAHGMRREGTSWRSGRTASGSITTRTTSAPA